MQDQRCIMAVPSPRAFEREACSLTCRPHPALPMRMPAQRTGEHVQLIRGSADLGAICAVYALELRGDADRPGAS